MNQEAVEWLEQDYDWKCARDGVLLESDGLVSWRAPGWMPGTNVPRPMIEIIHD